MAELTFKKRFMFRFHRMMDKIFRSNTHHRVMKGVIIMICLIISAVLAWLVYLDTP